MALFVLTLQLSLKGEGIHEQQVGLYFTPVALVRQFRPMKQQVETRARVNPSQVVILDSYPRNSI
jgi:hypothetical protein